MKAWILDIIFDGMVRLFCAVLVFVLMAGNSAMAAKLVIRIQAANKDNVPRRVDIRADLPARITPADIIDLAGLNLNYDVKSDIYYVEDSVELAAKEIKPFNIVMQDIWQVDLDELARYRQRANALASMLSGSKVAAEVNREVEAMQAQLSEISKRQNTKKITSVPPIEHIQAYELNVKALQDVKNSIGRMENLAMSVGVNPGQELIGDDISASLPHRDAHIPDKFGEAMMKITIKNPSATQSKTTNVRVNLPPELAVEDVIDAGGLGVRFDSKDKLTYVFKDVVTLQPNASITYKVVLKDKWNINSDRMQFLQKKANDLLEQCSGRNSIEAVVNTLKKTSKALESVMKEHGPTELSPAYIAFYRRQSDRLDEIERELNRVDSALKPLETNRGFDIPAPDKKTTWLVIYIILGFLAVMSLLFFLRWFVKSS
jgi:hypothetical protein